MIDIEYSDTTENTMFTYAFDWVNTGDVTSQNIFISFTIDGNEYIDYMWETLSKNSTGHTELYVVVDGDVSSKQPENINLFFIRRAYENTGWTFFDLTLSNTLIMFLVVVILLAVVLPITVIAVVLVVVHKKK